MRFAIIYEQEQRSYKILDFKGIEGIQLAPTIMTISESMMNRYLTGLLIMNGVIYESQD